VIAARLSEDPSTRVLLIEAGPPDEDRNIHVPIGYLRLPRERLDWLYESVPEEACADRRIRLPRGRVLGGSSSVNAMIYVRGNPLDYDLWGVPGWSWNDLLPYFLKAEDHAGGASRWHQSGGPLGVTTPALPHPFSTAFLAAAERAGIPPNPDFNGERQDGAGLFALTQRDGLRASAADAYLHPAASRPNLTVLTGVEASRIVFDGTGAATGVVCVRAREQVTYAAQREVIVCAGSYNSPKLLMLSGIGPGDHLREHGIEVLADVPAVGSNLQDHLAAELLWMAPEPEEREARRRWRGTRLLLAARFGAFASNLAEAGAFVRCDPAAPAPDVQLHMAPVRFIDDDEDDAGEAHGVWVSPCLLTPASRGTVRLASPDTRTPPLVHNGFLAREPDRARMLAALRLALRVSAQQPLAQHCATRVSVPRSEDEADLAEHLAETAFAFYHPVGTCRMGGDAASVLDPELRVRGVQRLRVVDASAMPNVPRGNTNAPTIALAERAADVIRGGGVTAAHPSG
jgi:choline dehydrogenase-like flavoprotein